MNCECICFSLFLLATTGTTGAVWVPIATRISVLASLSVSMNGILRVVDAAETVTTSSKSERFDRELPYLAQETSPKHQTFSERGHSRTATKIPTKQRLPNFVIVLTDDLDLTLGGSRASTLKRTRQWLGRDGGGKTFSNWFVQTPVCCASRAELLTGKMYHNLKVDADAASMHKGCMHVDVEDDPKHPFWDRDFFSNFLAPVSAFDKNRTNATRTDPEVWNLNYSVGIFGKLLNTHNPTSFVPNGVDEMLINDGGEYLNPTFTHGTRTGIERVAFDNCTESTGMSCYSTSVIGNASLSWIERQVVCNPRRNGKTDKHVNGHQGTPCGSGGESKGQDNPFFALISVKAPHIQDGNGFPMATPAPWYQNVTISERMAPRTPNYNATTVPGGTDRHHWLVRNQTPLTELEASKVDQLYVSRLKTLLSVDDLVEDLMRTLERLGVLDLTYIVFTSDNGYRLGQFRMPQCKLHPYENDIRVPMMIRGPGISTRGSDDDGNGCGKSNTPRKERLGALFSHVHLMPTLLGLATGQHDSQDIVPETMDGTNLAGWILDHSGVEEKEKEQESMDHRQSRGNKVDNSPRGTRSRGDRSASRKPMPNATIYSESILTNTATQQSTSLLIEYTSLGNVVRYQHLVDTYNHSFVALRIMPGAPRATNDLRANRTQSRIGRRTTQLGTTKRRSQRRVVLEETVVTPLFPLNHIANLKYVEFRDCRADWTNTKTEPLERELYDLDSDPYELNNLIKQASPLFVEALASKTRRLIECSGARCRTEQSYGLETDNDRTTTS